MELQVKQTHIAKEDKDSVNNICVGGICKDVPEYINAAQV